jgi:FkbM family methyltransferase
MRWNRLRKTFRYWFKSQVIALSPGLYWRLHEWKHGLKEAELAVLPFLGDAGKTAVDAGANFGVYTWHLAKHYRRCYAFEPTPHLAAVLRRGFRGREAQIIIHEIALSDREDCTVLRIPLTALGWSTIEPHNQLHSIVHSVADIREMEVACKPLDYYGLEDVGFIKIDVEGHELAVLRGATETISRSYPSILVEAEDRHRPGTVTDVCEYLSLFGYRRMILRNGQLVELQDSAMVIPCNFFFFQPDVAKAVQMKMQVSVGNV